LDATLIIAKNFPWCPEHDDLSFSGRLHEEGFWSWDEYWLLELALYELAGAVDISRELYWRVFRIFSYCFAALGHHLDPNDAFQITNLSRDEVYDAKERFQLVFEGFYEGRMPEPTAFEQQNPLFALRGSA